MSDRFVQKPLERRHVLIFIDGQLHCVTDLHLRRNPRCDCDVRTNHTMVLTAVIGQSENSALSLTPGREECVKNALSSDFVIVIDVVQESTDCVVVVGCLKRLLSVRNAGDTFNAFFEILNSECVVCVWACMCQHTESMITRL